jgi:hypothetical protein
MSASPRAHFPSLQVEKEKKIPHPHGLIEIESHGLKDRWFCRRPPELIGPSFKKSVGVDRFLTDFDKTKHEILCAAGF